MKLSVSTSRNQNASRVPIRLCWCWLFLVLVPFSNGAGTNRVSESRRAGAVQAGRHDVSPEQLRKAAEAGDAEAQYDWGMHEWNAALKQDDNAYRQWRSKTNQAPWSATSTHQNGPIRTNWESVSSTELLRAAEAGDRVAQQNIARLDSARAMARGRNAFEWLKKAANQSVPAAEYEVAWTYFGLGWRVVTPDPAEGMKWLRKAANDGSPGAQNRFGQMLIEGDLLAPDLNQGIEWLRRAADQGYAPAQLNLARQYSCGNGAPRSAEETAAALLRKAADSGLAGAQYALAERYRTGLGVPKDYIEAIRWYRSTVTNRNDPVDSDGAFEVLSLVDKNGRPSGREGLDDPGFVRALSLYVKAVDLGNSDAMSKIGDSYAEDDAGASKPAKAFFWYNLAAEAGSSAAAQNRDQLKPLLTRDDFARVRQWTKEFHEQPR